MARTSFSPYTSKMEAGTFWVVTNPVGSINGSNKTFTLPGIPNPLSSLELEVNGQGMTQDTDYTIVGDTITTEVAYPTGAVRTFVARYRAEP